MLVNILKSFTLLTLVRGNVPSQISATVVTPTTSKWEDPTLTTLALTGSCDTFKSVYWTRLPTVVIPGKFSLVLCITDFALKVTTPTVATPTLINTAGTTSALKVLIPTKPSSVP